MKKQHAPPPSSGPPPSFLAKMRRLLGEEAYGQFVNSYRQEAPTGLRANTLKISIDDFIRKSPFTLSPLGDHVPAGFLVVDNGRPGRHPYHAAGLYYLQEPSAMAVAALMRPLPGERVLDLAAAPGGKATHLATLMDDQGLLVANDIHGGRVRHLAQNLERWGVRRGLITNETPQRLADTFGPIFDKVLVDAPCSGEGMFRRKGSFEWSEPIVAACAHRQSAILETAVGLVRPGGLLAYATCTFSPEENEGVIADFLARHPAYALISPPAYEGFSPGRPDWSTEVALPAERRQSLHNAVRLWPHRVAGEGHFIALLRRETGNHEEARPHFKALPPLPVQAQQQWQHFAAQCLRVTWPQERLYLANGRLYLLPENALDTGSLKLVRYGLLLGEVRRGYFRPAHTLALSLTPAEIKETVNWTAADPQVAAYLSGHDLNRKGPKGWVVVTVDGYPLGWGKRVGGKLKNHYPRGLRHHISHRGS